MLEVGFVLENKYIDLSQGLIGKAWLGNALYAD
jgi:hypothetical protein